MSHLPGKRKNLGVISITLISISAIFTMKNFSCIALCSYYSIFFYSVTTLLFFVPLSLVCAELSARFPMQGGVYTWVSEAFGVRVGFLASWLDWIYTIFFCISLLTIMASTCSRFYQIELSNIQRALLMLSFLWSITILNLFPLKYSSLFSCVGAICGNIFPSIVLIILGIIVVFRNKDYLPLQVTIIPPFDWETLNTISFVMMGFSGIEVSSYYIADVKNPKKTYPKAFILTAIVVFILYVLCTLSVVALVPKDQINVTMGSIQAIERFNCKTLMYIMECMILIGTASLVNTWVISPLKGFIIASKEFFFSRSLLKTNQYGSPRYLLMIQGILGSLLIIAFTCGKVEIIFLFIEVITSQLMIIMYILIFMACIKFRIYEGKTKGAAVLTYKIPGGRYGFILITSMGILSCILAFVLGLIKPNYIDMTATHEQYAILVVAVILFVMVPALVLIKNSKKRNRLLASMSVITDHTSTSST